MMSADFKFSEKLWEGGGKGSWHFITVPLDVSGIIKMSHDRRTGFGSVRVQAEICGNSWKTSLFPDAKSGCYLLPVKAAVRSKSSLKSDSKYSVALRLID
jgi:hypothetical protein